MNAGLPPLSLYLHFPWCVRKCPYCDFNSHTLHGAVPEDAYVGALLRDLEGQLEAVQGREIHSVFFGGGTPSLFSPESLATLLTRARGLVSFAADVEITLEANPGTVERGRFAGYAQAGINRVSLGAQSFDPEQLARLGRIHAAQDTVRAAHELHAAGLGNFNLDLMYGLPQQQLAGAIADVDCALALEPAHVSHYQLTLEAGTVFGGRPPAGLPDADLAAEMQLECQQRLAAAGYAQYEVSAYARVGRECHHNLNYWHFGDYLGSGAGAHGKLSRTPSAPGWNPSPHPADGALPVGGLAIERTWREREPRRYLARDARDAREPRSAVDGQGRRAVLPADRPFEFMMNALRLVQGFAEPEYEARTGLPWSGIAPLMQRLQQRGMLVCEATRWRASTQGFSFLNDLLTEFLATPAHAEAQVGLRSRPKIPNNA